MAHWPTQEPEAKEQYRGLGRLARKNDATISEEDLLEMMT
jgi:hypothetical protein